MQLFLDFTCATLFLCKISDVAMSDINIFTQRLYKSVGLW